MLNWTSECTASSVVISFHMQYSTRRPFAPPTSSFAAMWSMLHKCKCKNAFVFVQMMTHGVLLVALNAKDVWLPSLANNLPCDGGGFLCIFEDALSNFASYTCSSAICANEGYKAQ